MPTQTAIKYFGYGTNRDLEMMQHMIGRQDINGQPGKLLGYELCIQKLEQIRDTIPGKSPGSASPREIIRKVFGDAFELFVARPKADGVIYGTIWELRPEEIALVKEWEMVELGMQEEVHAMAVDEKGNIIAVETQAVMDPPAVIDRIVTGDQYEPYIAPKDKMLGGADYVRADYLKRQTANLGN